MGIERASCSDFCGRKWNWTRSLRPSLSGVARRRTRKAGPYRSTVKCLIACANRSACATQFPQCAFVFHLEGQPLQSFREAWATACKKAGAEDLLFHDLRRSAVRNLTRAGVPRPQAMAITGHKTESVYVRYDIVDFQDLRDAATKMERFHDVPRAARTQSKE